MNILNLLSKHLWVHLWVFNSLGVVILMSTAVAAEQMRVSWYGPGFDGNYTANGEVFDRYAHTAAHPTWPFGTVVQLTNPNTGDRVKVELTPYDLTKGRITYRLKKPR